MSYYFTVLQPKHVHKSMNNSTLMYCLHDRSESHNMKINHYSKESLPSLLRQCAILTACYNAQVLST